MKARARRGWPAALRSLGVGSWMAVAACTGGIEADEADGRSGRPDPAAEPAPRGADPGMGAPPPGSAPASHLPAARASTITRRLSTQEIGNALEAMLGFRPAALAQLPADSETFLFDRVREGQSITEQHERGFEALANDVATRLLAGPLGALVPTCGANRSRWNRACGEAFLTAVAERAFRRPVTADERAAALRLFDGGQTFDEGFRLLVHRVFRSPHFLYLVEPGDQPRRALTDFEIAARLSFSLCETIPDAALWSDAKAGALAASPDRVAAHGRRLLGSACGRTTVRRFFSQWLRLEEVPHLSRNKTTFPTFEPALAAAMKAETERFVDDLVFERRGTVANLFDATHSIVDDETAAVYGLAKGGAAARRELPPERRGLLTQPSLLAVTSDDDATAPVLRGVFVLERMLCGDIPSPPADIEIAVPDLDSSKTTRERWERHSADPACATCHQLIDPVGFALEDFDAMGRHRTSENGKPLDVTGGVPLFGVPTGSVKGGAQLAAAIAKLPQARQCLARRWMRFALGRLEAATDEAALRSAESLAGKDAPVQDVLAALGATASFHQSQEVGP